jgi:capsule polysaccharide export protein KpsC/LpsZ
MGGVRPSQHHGLFMKTVAVYESVSSEIVDHLVKGFQKNEYKVKRLDINGFKENEIEKNVDLVVLHGLRGKYAIAKECYKKLGKSVLIFDFGYIDRVNNSSDMFDNYWYLGFDGFGWYPRGNYDKKRYEALEDKVIYTNREPSNKIYVCGQMPNDAQHNMNERELSEYFSKVISKLRQRLGKKYEIVFRPHPRATKFEPSIRVDLDYSSLEEVLSTAHCIVTYNSTVGLNGLMRGCPVVCDGDPYYGFLANNLKDCDFDNLFIPEKEDVEDFCCKLSYAQWLLSEIEDGLPIKYLKESNYI